jgi:hypothetical protein
MAHHPGACIIKLITAVIYGFSNKARVFVPGKPFQSNLVFVGKTRSSSKSGASERCFTQVGCSLIHKHYTRLERLARDKYTNFL